MVMRAHRERRQRHRDVAAVEADDDVLAALDQAVDSRAAPSPTSRPDRSPPRRRRLVAAMICCRGVGAPPSTTALRAGLLRRLALARIDVDDDRRCGRPSPCASARHIRPSPPAPMITVGSVFSVGPTFFSAP